MKVSEVTTPIIKDYLGISDTDSDTILTLLKSSALSYIVGYTGLTAAEIDTHEDITTAYLVLINEMFTTRTNTVKDDKENPCVKQILSMHSANYL